MTGAEDTPGPGRIERVVRVLRSRRLAWLLDRALHAAFLPLEAVVGLCGRLARWRDRPLFGKTASGFAALRQNLRGHRLLWKAIRAEQSGRAADALAMGIESWLSARAAPNEPASDMLVIMAANVLRRVATSLGNPGSVRTEMMEALRVLDRMERDWPEMAAAMEPYRQQLAREVLRTERTVPS